MARRMRRVFPQLADVQIEYVWGGYIDISLNRASGRSVMMQWKA